MLEVIITYSFTVPGPPYPLGLFIESHKWLDFHNPHASNRLPQKNSPKIKGVLRKPIYDLVIDQ